MEPETTNGPVTKTPLATNNNLHQVTPLSKYLAMVLFVILPFVGGWIGYHYAPVKVVEVEKEVVRYYVNEHKQASEEAESFNAEKDFRVISDTFQTDEQDLYAYGKKYVSTWYDDTIPRPETLIDLATFEYATSTYYVDKNDVYFHFETIGTDQLKKLNADRESFEIALYEPRPVWKDAKSVFYMGDKIEGADPDSFHYVGNLYYQDNAKVYYLWDFKDGPGHFMVVEGADPVTFEISNEISVFDAVDLANKYLHGSRLE